MSLRVRNVLYALGVVALTVLGLYLSAERMMLTSFKQAENEQVLADVKRVREAWRNETVQLASTARDYAVQDATYTFMADRNQGYIQKNLSDELVGNLNVNLLAFTDTMGKVVVAKTFDLDRGVAVSLPESVRDYLQTQSGPRRTTGFVVLPDALLLVASAPIVTREFEGPVRGSVVVGKFVNTRVARTLSRSLQLEVNLYRLDDNTLPPSVLAARNDLLAQGGTLSRPLSDAWIAGYTLLHGPAGQPAAMLRLETPRPIYAHALESRRKLMVLGTMLAVVFWLIVLLLQRGTWRRFAELSVAVKQIAESGNTGLRVALPGRDELTRVGSDLNLMLTSLAEAQASLVESEARYARAEKGVNDGIWDWNLQTNMLYYSPRYAAMLGYPEVARREGPGLLLNALHPDDLERVRRLTAEHLAGLTPQFEGEFRVATNPAAGTDEPCKRDYRWVLCRGVATYDENGVAANLSGSLTDIGQRGVFDVLTGLPNRLLLRRHLVQLLTEMAAKPSEASQTALLFLDLNRFKVINDSLGHDVGDQLLGEVGRRLQRAVRHSDMVARLGGDEFVLLLENVTPEAVTKTLGRIAALLTEPYTFDTQQVQTGASIGVVASLSDYAADQHAVQRRVEDLLRDADVAMSAAKKTHQPFVYFDHQMREQLIRRQRLEADLRVALLKHEFFLVYQSIVSLADANAASFEALVRWQHPSLGLISPAEFIPIAEETGLIVELGRWVLEHVCERLQSRPAEHADGQFDERVTVAVNLSPRQLGDPGLVAWLETLLARTGVSPTQLKLEVTEGAVMEEPERMIGLLTQLGNLGVKLAMDDFGTGYSSLSYIHELPIHTLKIDRSFVSRVTYDHKSLEVVRTIMALAQRLGLEVVAEGIETEAQETLLHGLGCTLMQGFYYAKPRLWDELGGLRDVRDRKAVSNLLAN